MGNENFKGEYKKNISYGEWELENWHFELMGGCWLMEKKDGIKQYDGIRLLGERKYKDKVDKKIDWSFKTMDAWRQWLDGMTGAVSNFDNPPIPETKPESEEAF
jgi:hypothetical protein